MFMKLKVSNKGRWIYDDEGYHCSECLYHAYGCIGEVLCGDWHYCPFCGALMDEVKHDNVR